MAGRSFADPGEGVERRDCRTPVVARRVWGNARGDREAGGDEPERGGEKPYLFRERR